MKSINSKNFFNFLAITWLVSLLVGCSVSIPDQDYLDAQAGFTDFDYPSNQICGHWFFYGTTYLSYRSKGSELRKDFVFKSDGTGKVRETTQFHGGDLRQDPGDGLIVLSAALSWEKVGPNTWRVNVPDSSQFRVERSNGPSISGASEAHSFRVRYYNGKLYDVDNMRTMVPIDQAKQKILRERSNIRAGRTTPIVIGG